MPIDRVKPLQVVPGEYASFEAAIKKFKKMVDKDGVLKEYRERRYFKSKSKKRYEKRRKKAYILSRYPTRN